MLLFMVLMVVGMLAPIMLFQWWMKRAYGVVPDVLKLDDTVTDFGKRYYQSLHEPTAEDIRQRKATKEKHATPPPKLSPLHVNIKRLADDETASHDDDNPVALADLMADEQTKRTDKQ